MAKQETVAAEPVEATYVFDTNKFGVSPLSLDRENYEHIVSAFNQVNEQLKNLSNIDSETTKNAKSLILSDENVKRSTQVFFTQLMNETRATLVDSPDVAVHLTAMLPDLVRMVREYSQEAIADEIADNNGTRIAGDTQTLKQDAKSLKFLVETLHELSTKMPGESLPEVKLDRIAGPTKSKGNSNNGSGPDVTKEMPDFYIDGILQTATSLGGKISFYRAVKTWSEGTINASEANKMLKDSGQKYGKDHVNALYITNENGEVHLLCIVPKDKTLDDANALYFKIVDEAHTS